MGQFATTEKYLPKHKDRASLASPDPGPAFIQWKERYIAQKEAESARNPIAANVFENVSEVPRKTFRKSSETFPRAVAVAVAGAVAVAKPSYPLFETKKQEHQAFDELARKIYAAHPNKSGKILFEQAMAEKLSSAADPGALAAQIEAAHRQWLPSWQRDAGRYAPRLDRWIAADGFLDDPPTAEDEDDEPPLRTVQDVIAEEDAYPRGPVT